MTWYRVELRGGEVYSVEADSPAEARQKWAEGASWKSASVERCFCRPRIDGHEQTCPRWVSMQPTERELALAASAPAAPVVQGADELREDESLVLAFLRRAEWSATTSGFGNEHVVFTLTLTDKVTIEELAAIERLLRT